jgi:peptide-methionine (S)-S-oxide reductase
VIFGARAKTTLPTAENALRGRETRPFHIADEHVVLHTPLQGPWPDGTEVLYIAMGCFWGAERIFWRLPGVVTTAAGYMGGLTPNPTYEETCTGRTGHTEAVQVVYDPSVVGYETLLKTFWENHDPTQGMRQGNDVGTQYRSAVYTTTEAQLAAATRSREVYGEALAKAGRGAITTEILPAGPYYYAEPYHQQYLDKNPNGYCNHGFNGVSCPIGLNVPAQIDVAPPRG